MELTEFVLLMMRTRHDLKERYGKTLYWQLSGTEDTVTLALEFDTRERRHTFSRKVLNQASIAYAEGVVEEMVRDLIPEEGRTPWAS